MELKFNNVEQVGAFLIIDTNDNALFVKIIKKAYENSPDKANFSFSTTEENAKITFNANGLTKTDLFRKAYELGGLIKSINFNLRQGFDISYFI